ncbi:MAG: hydantoinase B/oxoprolinase family protein, partial [Nocardioidaceae bacterium]
MPISPIDNVTVEVLANMYRAVVDEMAWVLLRSSHTTFVKETQDFSTGLVTPEGEMFAAPHTKGATPLMGIPMGAGTTAVDDWAPGDVLVTNDPYATAGMVMQVNDLYAFRPIFCDGRLVCFAWAFIHCTDVGGAVPGSIDMKHVEIHQEGTRLRPMRLFRRGELNEDIWNIFADNSRIPDLNWGDVSALLAALQIGERRVHDLIGRHSEPVVRSAMYQTLDNTERLTKQVLARIPAGSYSYVEYFEDDYTGDVPVRIEMELTAREDGTVKLDFTGSDPQVRAAINLPTGGHRHHPFLCLALVNFVATHAEGLHLNAGILRCIDLRLPESSIVNADYPAACGMRYTTACRIHEVVLGALNQAVPTLVPSGGASHAVITYISTSEVERGGRVVVANPVQGGSGAGLDLDGESAIDFPAAFLRNVPVEVLEAEAPVTVHRLRLRPDTEGAGSLRGGFGLEYALQVRRPGAVVVMRGKDRHLFSSFGADGGRAGATAGCIVTHADGTVTDIGKETVYRPDLNDVITISTGGGGGKGDPIGRDPDAVAADVADGMISPARADELYGVVLRDRRVD